VNVPWTDEELMQELSAALREQPADEHAVRAARAALSWRALDAELVALAMDSAVDLAASALVRGGELGATRILAFRGDQLSVEIEIDEAGIAGQLTPARPGQVTLVTPDGPQVTSQADTVGCFTLPAPPAGPVRLDCLQDGVRFVTEWIAA
jgi:hypothetical protein